MIFSKELGKPRISNVLSLFIYIFISISSLFIVVFSSFPDPTKPHIPLSSEYRVRITEIILRYIKNAIGKPSLLVKQIKLFTVPS